MSEQDRAAAHAHLCPGCGGAFICTLLVCRGQAHRPHWACITSGRTTWPPTPEGAR